MPPSLFPSAHSSPTALQCRAVVTQVLRIGPDTFTADGRTVAQVLPDIYWLHPRGGRARSNTEDDEDEDA